MASDGSRHPTQPLNDPSSPYCCRVGAKWNCHLQAGLATYPHEVVRARMQFEIVPKGSRPTGLWATAVAIFRGKGLRGLYVGVALSKDHSWPRLFRAGASVVRMLCATGWCTDGVFY
jgi:hypothetical protein